VKTVDSFFLPGESEEQKSKRHPQFKALQQHNKAGSNERRLADLVNENFRTTSDLETYVLHCC
jgi:beta-mannosidase